MRIFGSLTALIVLCLSIIFAQRSEASLSSMSIDLGSQYMKIALVKPGIPMEIVLNKESGRKTPTIVAFKNDERFFGDAAAQMSVKFPANSITFVVDLIGKQFNDSIVIKYQKDFPHLKLQPHSQRDTVVFDIDNKSYEVETILAMLLWNAKEQTMAFANQPVKNVVISIPSYFNQAERVGVATAAKIAGLNVLSLMQDGSAAALNYGVFRRKEITEKPQNLLIYDVGATKTIATLVEYQLEKKEPQVKVLGIGYNRLLGGRDVTQKLLDHLVSEFKKNYKTTRDILENPRAMAKLWKEAERVKQVLSANTDHFAQVESLFEDKDFKVKVSRDLIEGFIKELEPTLTQPLNDALKTIDFKPEQVETVVLMGAGTRIPSIQKIVKDYFGGRELARFLNTDEAIALGSVYEAAHLSKGFRVKTFNVHDLNVAPESIDLPESYFLSLNTTVKNATSILKKFEFDELVKRSRDATFNSLESLIYDTNVKLHDEWLERKDFAEDFQAIKQEVDELKLWIENEAVNADLLTLHQKREKLFGMINEVHSKEKKRAQEELLSREAILDTNSLQCLKKLSSNGTCSFPKRLSY